MARIELYKNVFDTSDCEKITPKSGITIGDVINDKISINTPSASSVEVYNPETDKTTYMSLNTETGITKIFANGLLVDSDYIIQEADVIVVFVLPASKEWEPSTATLLEGIAGVALIVMGALLTVYTGGFGATVGGYMINGGISLVLLGGINYALEVYSAYNSDKKGAASDDEQDKNPSVSGSKNQPLANDVFPCVIGSPFATPKIIGSPYNEFEYDRDNQGHIIFTDEHGNLKSNILGTNQPMYELLAVGYSPLYIDNIKLDELNLAHNQNQVLVGTLSYNKDADGFLADAEGNTIVNVDGEKIKGGEIGESWNSNKIQVEISQFGENRNLYKNVVKQKNVNAALLYCYSKEYSEVATERTITWQGGTFPAGMRTNTIHFTDGVPWKIAVGIDIPNGLYKEWQQSGAFYYQKIPMNLVIQWRPYYRYVKKNNLDSKEGIDTCYNGGKTEEKIIYKFRKPIYVTVEKNSGGSATVSSADKAKAAKAKAMSKALSNNGQ